MNFRQSPAKDDYQEQLLDVVIGSEGTGSQVATGTARPVPTVPAMDGYQQPAGMNLQSTAAEMAYSRRLPDMQTIIPKGTPIPCAINPTIQSDQAGLLTCTVVEDIYSGDRRVVLVARGSISCR